ncbi:hypothetical protein H5410_058573 [Solanum commersonii]|uniref:Uncharacterized protein n=1 Tax=Solanum commersonii TaxID=4109 RepID=A0A9J5WT31_SOLCO|nr:hypothetical protein H5410_058573 [Solanum commersonii]
MELHATVSDLFKNKMSEMMGELPIEDSLPVEDSIDSSGSLPESLSSWISNPNSIIDALELEKSTTTKTTDEIVVFGSKDIIDPGPPICDSELEARSSSRENRFGTMNQKKGKDKLSIWIGLGTDQSTA